MARTKKKTTRKQAALKSGSLPRGYTAITGFGESWPGKEATEGMELIGTIDSFDERTQERKQGKKTVKVQVKLAKISDADGHTYTIWESAGLKPLFELEEGTEIYIRYDGLGQKKPGQNPPRLYTLGVK